MIVSCLYDFPSYGWKSPAVQRMTRSTWTCLHANVLCKVFLFSNLKGNVGALEPRPPKRGKELKKKQKSLSFCLLLSLQPSAVIPNLSEALVIFNQERPVWREIEAWHFQ